MKCYSELEIGLLMLFGGMWGVLGWELRTIIKWIAKKL